MLDIPILLLAKLMGHTLNNIIAQQILHSIFEKHWHLFSKFQVIIFVGSDSYRATLLSIGEIKKM